MLRTTIASLLILIGTLNFATNVFAADDTRPLDEQLLDDFDDDPIDPLDRQVSDEPRKPPGETSEGADDNPLLAVARDMREVEERIARAEVGTETRDLQQQIVADLDDMLEQARKACKQGKPSGKQPRDTTNRQPNGPPGVKPAGGNKPNNKSTNNSQRPKQNGKTHRPDAEEMDAVLKKLWGELPERQREQMSQWQLDEFLPKYELLIEEYFRRLSRGKKEGQE
jgi:hypothetical protein